MRRVGVLVVLVAVTASCGDDGGETASDVSTTSTSASPGDFCEVQPRFAEQLNTALANLDPDAAQHTLIGGMLEELAPMIDELRAAEPAELDGAVDTWVAEMQRFAAGEPVAPAEEARGRMDDWVAANC